MCIDGGVTELVEETIAGPIEASIQPIESGVNLNVVQLALPTNEETTASKKTPCPVAIEASSVSAC